MKEVKKKKTVSVDFHIKIQNKTKTLLNCTKKEHFVLNFLYLTHQKAVQYRLHYINCRETGPQKTNMNKTRVSSL